GLRTDRHTQQSERARLDLQSHHPGRRAVVPDRARHPQGNARAQPVRRRPLGRGPVIPRAFTAMYRALDADKIVATIDLLKQRIEQRFPGAGLSAVAGDLLDLARNTEAEAIALARPNRVIQVVVGFVIAMFVSLIVFALLNIPAPTNTESTNILQ